MIKSLNQRPSKSIEIDLTSHQGNAFYLLAVATKLCKQLGLDSNQVCNEMKSGDYDNLVSVMDKYLGDYIILYR